MFKMSETVAKRSEKTVEVFNKYYQLVHKHEIKKKHMMLKVKFTGKFGPFTDFIKCL